ncbi:hypothetical protein KNE10_003604 [Salmonella enterica]|nr:hypothetical protein [Salmonella enterica]EIW2617774.1 hypothetical protein [Salmonella enterica]
MKEFKGTPGPWSLSEGWIDKHVSVDAKEHGAIALVLSDMESDYTCSEVKRAAKQAELSANAQLIAAAPELLDALRGLIKDYKALADSGDAGFWRLEYQESGKKAMLALAKALGEE